ncbi:MAG: tetratricopeptide repeat protein [Acidiferrobacterales bacterium]
MQRRPNTAEFANLAASAEAWRRGDVDDVIRLTTEAIELGHLSIEDIAIAYYQRGLAYSKKNLCEQAMEDLNEAIRLNPKFARAYYHRGYVLRRTDQDDQAIEDYNRAIRLDPEFVPAYINRGVLHVDKGLYYHALQDFHQAIRLDPTDARTYSDRGCAFFGNGHYNRALEDFNEALRLDPTYAVAHLHRGHVYCVTESFDQAIEEYSQAIALDPRSALAYRNRGDVYFYQGRFSEAESDYDTYLRLRPEDAAVMILLHLAHVRSGKHGIAGLARRAKRIALNKWPGAAVAMFLGDATPDEAILQAIHDEETVNNGGEHLAFFYAGQYHLLQGRTDRAVGMFRQALIYGLKNCFEHTFAEAELKRLGVTVLIPPERR